MKKVMMHVLLIVSASLWAQEEDFTKLPGYIDMSRILDIDPSQATTEVEIKNPLLSLVAAATEDEDAELSGLLQSLKLIKVYSFEVDSGQAAGVRQRIETLDRQMRGDKWDRFIRVRDEDELTNVYLKMEQKRVVGLTVLSVEDDETVFVNIIGDIDMESVGKLGEKFDIPKLDSVQTKTY